MNSRPTAVYRFYDGAGVLLYVGITCDLSARLNTHKGEKPGWRHIARIELTWYESKQAARAAEVDAIRDENPLWNVNGSGRSGYWSKWPGVVEWMHEQITTGAWPAGERLPSAAAFARASKGISYGVIRRAIEELISRGALRGQLGKGVYVAETLPGVGVFVIKR